MAAATQERRLLAVACRPMLGCRYAVGCGWVPPDLDADTWMCSLRYLPRPCTALRCPLLDHLVRLEEERRRDREPEHPGGLEIDDQLELHGLLHRQVRRLGALQNLVHVDSSAAR